MNYALRAMQTTAFILGAWHQSYTGALILSERNSCFLSASGNTHIFYFESQGHRLILEWWEVRFSASFSHL